jgi:hypothetical protein
VEAKADSRHRAAGRRGYLRMNLSVEQIREIIERYDEKLDDVSFMFIENGFISVFEATNQNDLAQKVKAWAEENIDEDDEEPEFYFEFYGPGLYVVTTPQYGAYEGARRVMCAAEVIDVLIQMNEDRKEEILDYVDCLHSGVLHDWKMKYDGLYAHDYILNNGKAVYLGCYDYPNGSIHAVEFDGKFYKLVHDGTGNEFFHSRKPEVISEDEVQEIIVCNADDYKEYHIWAEKLGLSILSEEEYLQEK